MALEGIHIIVHNSNGISNMDASSATGTFQNVLNVLKTGQPSNGVSLYAGNIYGTGQEIGLSLTEGGTPLTLSSLITSEFQDGTTGTLYALYPEPSVETITGFYLDGTEYKIGGTGGNYTAGEGIGIGTVHSDMQGPAPDGFHVPLDAEWRGVRAITNGLSLSTGDGWRINLHMPFAGRRDLDSASLDRQGSYGYYWASSPYPSGPETKYLTMYSSFVSPGNIYRAYGFSVRCFKDSYVAPDSNWTVIAGTLGSAGIFWNQSEGLISITDGTNGYTMMDKNLGATTVYNDGDTLSEANCGKYYQWGNNYGFAWTGSVTTSSTQVDANTYGPGNYYSSSTFITGSNDWSSVRNNNLRGGETQGTWIGGDGNTIGNTGVLSVNGQTGNVTIQTYTAGNGIDITNDEIGLNGTYEGLYSDYSVLQGPSPSGFHVPLITEWLGLRTIMKGLGLTTGDSWKINLHIPFAGRRKSFTVTLEDQGTVGYYWSSSPETTSTGHYSRACAPKSSGVEFNYSVGRAYGCSIRCFKNSYVKPTSSWIVINGTLGGAGIFWNQSEGLISITDGTAGYTIMDKNLGATTVYNNGDTLTQANMGNMYQWGNNYGFPSTGTITNTSSTQVDASNYGPGNYYSSSTLIKQRFAPVDWSSVPNDNLRGGETYLLQTSGNLILGDQLYKIVTSTSAPASGTASNIITISTGSTKGLYVGTTKIV